MTEQPDPIPMRGGLFWAYWTPRGWEVRHRKPDGSLAGAATANPERKNNGCMIYRGQS